MSDALDGNAAGGVLQDLFAVEMTEALTVCAGCGDRRPVGELVAYVAGPGLVLRCRSCRAVQIKVVRSPDRIWADLRGVRVCSVRTPAGGVQP